jgi:hypothetical protein
MKPFDPNKPVQTRDGRKARILCADLRGIYPIVAVVDNEFTEDVARFTATGHFWSDQLTHSDLINIPEKRIVDVYTHFYADGSIAVRDYLMNYSDHIHCIHKQIEIEVP